MTSILTHSAELIDGTVMAERVTADAAKRVDALKARGITPGLTVVLVGDDPASAVYVGSKERTCKSLGMNGETIRLPATATEAELMAVVDRLNADPAVHGILVQMPLPKQMNADA
jgi:methylenetetrahydrofolate dehydrogenase (NADP+)/methenyltetrahydrofolate cyclohydrolase